MQCKVEGNGTTSLTFKNTLVMNFSFSIESWGVEEELGYTPKTTFWQDFSIADKFGASAVKDTYRRAFRDWKSNYIYLTELVLVLNHKCWRHYDHGNTELSELYSDLYYKCKDYAETHLKEKEFDYYFSVTD